MATGKVARFFKMAGMTASVASRFAGLKVMSAFMSDDKARNKRAAAQAFAGGRIARTLGELKGPVMKAGQMASISSDLLPKSLSEPLAALRKDAPPVPFATMRKQIVKELGRQPEELFSSFEEEPFAAASIGQVHRAVTDDGRQVVVKIQYPGVERSCDADLSQLKFVLKASGMFKNKKDTLNAFFDEMSARLHEELDYTLEADNVRLMGEFFEDWPRVTVPKVVGERSAQRVLTLSYEPGDPLEAVRDYPEEVRDEIGARLMEMVFEQIFRLGVLHSDPNPANFAFHDDGTVVLYDFGSVKRFTEEEVSAARKIVGGIFIEDYDNVELGMRELGARNLDGPPVDLQVYKTWRDALEPVFSEEPFDFGASTLHRKMMSMLPEYTYLVKSFKLPVGLMLVQRTLVGLYGNLRNARSRVAGGTVVGRILEASG